MKKEWKPEFEHVKRVFPDAEVFPVDANYELFHAVVDGVRMIFYPHKTSAGNYHVRVRNGTPGKKTEFSVLAMILQESKPPSCTFSVKNGPCWYIEEKQEEVLSMAPQYRKYYDASKDGSKFQGKFV